MAVVGHAGPSGYWRLVAGPDEEHVTRSELLTGAGASAPGAPILTVAQLADLHLCDSQSPARAEFLDRWADDDAPTKPQVQAVGTYRAQDCLTVQVGQAMVQAVNAVAGGPVGGKALQWAITCGDVTDNAQGNELGWYLGLLDGGRIVPDSGRLDRYEGVADRDRFDESFWHPEPGPDVDRPRRLHGFPDAPGLLDALRRPFDAPGLDVAWLAVHGNHDQMIQGTLPVGDGYATLDQAALNRANTQAAFAGVGLMTDKAIDVPADWSTQAIADFCHALDNAELAALQQWQAMRFRTVTADPARGTITRSEFIQAHHHARAEPSGHGFTLGSTAYYRHDDGPVTVLTLDTVNEHGGWQGSLDPAQLDWLEGELTAADAERRYVILASHHPLRTLTNAARHGSAGRRVLADELDSVLARHRSLVLWLNGHTHTSTVTPHSGWWEVTCPSMIDFPQQGRIIELLQAPGELTIACTMLDHAGELPWSGSVDSVTAMAGLSRELAANDWQTKTADLARHSRVGTSADRNVLLRLADPFG